MGNGAKDGGGIHIMGDQASPVIENNLITQNTSGGIGVFLNASPTIDGNTITDNHGPHLIAGGLFVALDASPVITNNTIQGNQGGALWVDDSSSILDALVQTRWHISADDRETGRYILEMIW